MVSNIRKKLWTKSYYFQWAEKKFPLAGMKNLFKNTFHYMESEKIKWNGFY